LEEKQRAEARERKETGVEWQQNHFQLEGESWTYKHSLDKRRDAFYKSVTGSPAI